MVQVMLEKLASAAAVEQISNSRNEPAWVRKARQDAWAIYEKTPMPTLNDELWRRTDISTLKLDRLQPVLERAPQAKSLVELPDGLLLADSYHVSRYNTNTGLLTREMFEQVVFDLMQRVAQAIHARVGRPVGDELADARCHLLAVSGDVADEVPGDPVVDANRVVLPSAVPQPPLEDAPQARPGGQVQEDDCVGGFAADRQAGGVVSVDDPPRRGYQIPLQGRERLLVQRLPVPVVVQAVQVYRRDPEPDAE